MKYLVDIKFDIEDYARRIYHIGTEETNWKILNSLPSSVKDLSEKLNIQNDILSQRIQELKDVQLVKEERTNDINTLMVTDAGKQLIDEIHNVIRIAIKEVMFTGY